MECEARADLPDGARTPPAGSGFLGMRGLEANLAAILQDASSILSSVAGASSARTEIVRERLAARGVTSYRQLGSTYQRALKRRGASTPAQPMRLGRYRPARLGRVGNAVEALRAARAPAAKAEWRAVPMSF